MRIGILTRSLPPYICGIGDHTMRLAGGIRELGHEMLLIAGRGQPGASVLILGDDFSTPAVNRLQATIKTMKLDHLVLQYTPLLYAHATGRGAGALARTWESLGGEMATSIIVHETYFRTWRYPLSLLRGTLEKQALQAICRASHHVFTASEPLHREMASWGLRRRPVILPISSNIPVAEADIGALRARHGIALNTLVLTLFGGGNALKWMLGHVFGLERRLQAERIPHVWLLLGGVPRNWLPPDVTVLDPGRLPLTSLSAYLQMTDIFLIPHWPGLCAKRGTLMAALDHALPVVGTRGEMTDDFWGGVEGVELVDGGDAQEFARSVIPLARDRQRRLRMGDLNKAYFARHLTWPELTRRFLGVLEVVETVR